MEYKNSGPAVKEIEAMVNTIKKQVQIVSFAGKRDALSTLVDISLEMLESTRSTLAHEIRKSYYFPSLDDTVERIIDRLSKKEVYILQEDGELVNELEQCREIAKDYALDMCSDGAIEKLTDGLSDEEDSEYDDAQRENAGSPSPQSVIEKTAAMTPRVGSWLKSLEPAAAPLISATAV